MGDDALAPPKSESPEKPSKPPETVTDQDKSVSATQPIPAEILEKFPPEFRQSLSMFMASIQTRNPIAPVLEKIQPEHITKALESHERDQERTFNETKRESLLRFGTLWVGAATVAAMMIYLYASNKAAEVQQLLTMVGALLGGGGIATLMKKRT